MHLLRRPELRIALLAAIGAAAWLTVRHSGTPEPTPASSAPPSWTGLVGTARPAVDLSGRYIVVLKTPSVAQRVARVQVATESAERRWTAEAFAAQQQVLTQLARHGLSVRPDYSFARVLDGFSGALDPRAVELLEHNPEVAGVYAVRAAYPASLSASRTAAASIPAGVPGLDGTGITIGLLDTGVDGTHPYVRGRVLPGIDIVGGTSDTSPQTNPQQRRQVERHGTELAGVLVGAGGPARHARCGAGRLGPADPRRRLAADGHRTLRGLRAQRPADRRPRPGRRPERRRRRARCPADRARRRRRALRLVRRQPRGSGHRRRADPRHARRRPGGERRRRGAALRLRRRPGGRSGRARRRRHGLTGLDSDRPRDLPAGARRPRRRLAPAARHRRARSRRVASARRPGRAGIPRGEGRPRAGRSEPRRAGQRSGRRRRCRRPRLRPPAAAPVRSPASPCRSSASTRASRTRRSRPSAAATRSSRRSACRRARRTARPAASRPSRRAGSPTAGCSGRSSPRPGSRSRPPSPARPATASRPTGP